MKKTIALALAMLFAVCALVTTAFAENESSTAAITASTVATTNDEPDDGFNSTTSTTAKADESSTATTAKADESSTATTAKADESSTSATASTSAAAATTELTVNANGTTAYLGQGEENNSTSKKPAAVDTTIPSTGSGIVVPAIALAVLAAGTVAVIKTKKDEE